MLKRGKRGPLGCEVVYTELKSYRLVLFEYGGEVIAGGPEG